MQPNGSCYQIAQWNYRESISTRLLIAELVPLFYRCFLLLNVTPCLVNYVMKVLRHHILTLLNALSGGFDVTESWEWREGRLLAYELILKFLIANHIHYTFPAYTFTRNMQAKKSQEEHR